MSRNLSTAGLVLAVSATAVFSSFAAGAGLKTLSGHVPAVVSHLHAKGRLPATNELTLAIGLPLHNTEALTNLLQQMYDPASTNYHHYLSPAEFTAQFGPTEQDYQAAVDFAQANGLRVVGTHPNRMLLKVSGKASAVEAAFGVTLKTYHHPTENRDFFAADSEPVLAASLPINHVSGLENYSEASPRLKAHSASQMPGSAATTSTPANGAAPNIGSAPGGNYEGQDFRTAYVPGTTLTGAGQNVGLFQLDGFYPNDIAAYENQIGLTTNLPQLVVVPVDGGVPVPTPFGNPEVSLDIEMVLSMSPGVSNIFVYEGPNFSNLSIYTIFEDVLNRMANDNVAKQIGCSWYIVNGLPDPVSEQIFQQMALQGQSFFAASGDSDAYTGFIAFPSDSPHITLVGGTTLTTGASASYTSETVWNWDIEFGPGADGIGSSGGVSTTYAIPSWQTNISITLNGGSTTMRNLPDVALTADHVWVIYGSGSADWFGGTSCAAPLWAGFTALINQQAALIGHAPVGFLNPALYAIASGPNYTNCFHDITTGNNEWSGSPSLFSAVTGYDLCTGLGTPNGTNLINALVLPTVTNTVVHLSPPPPPYGTTLSGLNGSNPNGNWFLFIQDDSPPYGGMISNGWILTLTTANPVGYAADLAVTQTASPSSVLVGSNLVFSITVTNFGPSTASNVVVSDVLPSGLTLISSNSTLGGISLSGSTVTWTNSALTNGAGAQINLVVQTSVVGTIVNQASSYATTSDPNPAEDTASVTVNVVSGSLPQLSASYVGNHQFHFSITDLTQQGYVVQASTNLVTWVPVYTNPTPATTITTFTDSSATTNYPYRFYRVLLQ